MGYTVRLCPSGGVRFARSTGAIGFGNQSLTFVRCIHEWGVGRRRSEMALLLREAIGDSLRRTRVSQSRTLREVSNSARVSLGYLSEIERGRKEASSELLAAICDALEVRCPRCWSTSASRWRSSLRKPPRRSPGRRSRSRSRRRAHRAGHQGRDPGAHGACAGGCLSRASDTHEPIDSQVDGRMPRARRLAAADRRGRTRVRCATVAHRVAHGAAHQMEAGSTHG